MKWPNSFLFCDVVEQYQPSAELKNSLKECEFIKRDIVLKAVDGEVPAHKNVLKAFSPYFKAMFSHETVECHESCINLPTLTLESLKPIVEFAYTNEISITAEIVQDLLIAANFLNIPHIEKKCSVFIADHLDNDNCLDVLMFALNQGFIELVPDTIGYIARRLFKLEKISSHKFYQIPEESCLQLIEHKHIGYDRMRKPGILLPNEEEYKIYEVAIKYINFNIKSRSNMLPNILRKLRLPLMNETAYQIIRNQATKWKVLDEVEKVITEAKNTHIEESIWKTPRLRD